MQAKIQFNCVISPYPAQKIVNLPLFKMNMELKEHFNNKIFKLISETADELGLECYVVGGYVRDIFLARPSKDIDVVVVGSGIEMAQTFGKKLGRGAHVSVFKNFGTAQVKYHDTEVEFVGARKESYSHDSRKPVVEDGTLEDDQNRRDFTINAMAYAPGEGVIDLYGGRSDLAARVVRCVGTPADRFAEDALRILRALRFSAKLGFALDPATEAAALAARDTLHTVSAERLYTELDGLLLAPGAGQTLAQYGEILSGAVPEILPCIGCTQPGKWHCYDVWQHSAAAVGALDLRGQDTRGVRVLCWATFLHDIAKPLCRSVGPDGAAHFKGHNQRGAQLARVILRRLKAPAYLVDGAVGLIAVHDAPLPADDVGILKLLNRSGAIFLRRLCALKYADLDAHANTPEVAARRADVAAFERRMNELAKTGCYTMRQLAVNGADLMDIGIPAGPGVGATLQTLLNDVMEGTLPNEREALLAAAVK